MRSTISFIITLSSLVIGVFGLIVIEVHSSKIPYSFLWAILCFVIIIFGFKLFFSSGKYEEKRAQKKRLKERADFISKADKILIHWDECKVITNNYTLETERGGRLAGYDAIYEPSRNVIRKDINQAVIVYESDKYGQMRKFYSPTINKEEVLLNFLLKKNKEIFLYVNRFNQSEYLFDLDFLNDDLS